MHAGRLVGDGVPASDVIEAEQILARWDEWYDFWSAKGQRYEQLAETALVERRYQTAGQLFWYASITHHYAQFLWFADPQRRERGQREKVRLYQRAAPYLSPPAERFLVQHMGMSIPGYLRFPPGQGPFPCVVLLGGLESTKEESYMFENLCLARGVATCTFDGPGQGEFYFQCPLRRDFESFTSAVVDYLQRRPEIDISRIGILGRSLGGYYAVRSAAADRRFIACAAWGVLFDLSFYDRMHPLTQLGFAYVSGHSSPQAAAEFLKRAIDLSDIVSELRCPLYVLHGGRDHLIPTEQVERLREAAVHVPEAVWDIPVDGNHCCHNLSHIVRPRLADWLAEKLGGRL